MKKIALGLLLVSVFMVSSLLAATAINPVATRVPASVSLPTETTIQPTYPPANMYSSKVGNSTANTSLYGNVSISARNTTTVQSANTAIAGYMTDKIRATPGKKLGVAVNAYIATATGGVDSKLVLQIFKVGSSNNGELLSNGQRSKEFSIMAGQEFIGVGFNDVGPFAITQATADGTYYALATILTKAYVPGQNRAVTGVIKKVVLKPM